MSNHYLKIGIPLIISTVSIAFADETPKMPAPSEQKPESKFIRNDYGVDVFWAQSSTVYRPSMQPKVTYRDSNFYTGFRWNFEQIKPKSYYAGLKMTLAFGESNQKVYVGHRKDFQRDVSKNLWLNYEAGLGYNFRFSNVSNAIFSIFGGPGYHLERKFGERAHWLYGMAGFKISQDLGETFSLDADFKTTYSFDMKDPYNVSWLERKGEKRFWGFEAGLPITWHLGTERKFDLSFRPYVLKFNIDSPETVLGSHLELGMSY